MSEKFFLQLAFDTLLDVFMVDTVFQHSFHFSFLKIWFSSLSSGLSSQHPEQAQHGGTKDSFRD